MRTSEIRKLPAKTNRVSTKGRGAVPTRRTPSGPQGASAQDAAIDSLVRDLASGDGAVRQRARRKLVTLGKSAVPLLTESLRGTGSQLRWEAAKTLVGIADSRAARALARCLEDEDAGTRWVAAEALIALNRDALVPVLEALVHQSDSLWVREGAHHVLHELATGELRAILRPVLGALEGPAPDDVAPIVAAEALNELDAIDH